MKSTFCALMMFLVLGLSGTPAGAQIAGDVVIEPGETVVFQEGGTRYTGTLTIGAGATLRFPPGAFLEMWRDTQFVVNGTESAPVVFECTDPTMRWSGILIEARSTGVVHHARFTGVVNGFSLRTDSSLVIRDSSFSMGEPGVVGVYTGFSTTGISGIGASIDVDRCEFGPFVGGRGVNAGSGDGGVGRPAYGIQMQDYNDIRVTNSVFRDITGGRGGRGGDGADGDSGSSPGESGEHGEQGGEGGVGGTAYALSASNQLNPGRPLSGEVIFAQNLVLRIKGGRGGDGGMGGNGGTGANGARGSDGGPFTCGNNGGNGGNGGDGGRGGDAGDSGESVVIHINRPHGRTLSSNNTVVDVQPGEPGTWGQGGFGRHGGSGGPGGTGWYCNAYRGADGRRGYDGSRGSWGYTREARFALYTVNDGTHEHIASNNIIRYADGVERFMSTTVSSTPDESSVVFRNGIVFIEGEGEYVDEPNQIYYSLPVFSDPANGDYSLLPGTVGVDAGDNTAVAPGLTTDLAGNPRFLDDPGRDDTGVVGGLGGLIGAIVDIGAYEQHIDARCNAADLVGPFGLLDLQDITAFVDAFTSGDDSADLTEPVGLLDLADLVTFINEFSGGCP